MSRSKGAVTQRQSSGVRVRHANGKSISSEEEGEAVKGQFVSARNTGPELLLKIICRYEGEGGDVTLEKKGQIKDA